MSRSGKKKREEDELKDGSAAEWRFLSDHTFRK
jgi:hypothetical protein